MLSAIPADEPPFWRRNRAPLLLLAALLAFFCCRDEETRAALAARVRTTEDFARQWRDLLWPPWRPLLIYVSLDDDVHLYYEYTRLILGEEADLGYIASRHGEDPAAELAELRARVARRPRGPRLPYRDVMVEYPPVALAMMMAPRLVARSYAAYSVAYAALASLLYLLSWWLAWRLTRRLGPARAGTDELLRRAVAATAAVGPLLVSRLDVLPAALLVGAVLLLASGWPAVAGLLILIGAGAKLFPLLLLPAICAFLGGAPGEGRRQLGRLLGALGAGALACGGAYLLLGRELPLLGRSVGLYGARPVQIESLVGALALALGAEVRLSFGSVNALWPGGEALARAWGPLMLALLLGHAALAWRWSARRGPLPAEERAAALCAWVGSALCLVWLTSKVLSPQYLIWGVPLLCVLGGAGGRRVHRAMVAALALTQLFFPLLYVPLQQRFPPAVLLLLLRNGALLWLGWLVLPRLGRAAR